MKTHTIFYALALFAILFTACKKDSTAKQEDPIPVASITLNKAELVLSPGDTTTLVATVHPENATNKTLLWKSSDTTVVTVTGNGLVTAIADGKATITATTPDGGKSATCSVSINYRNQWIGEWDFTSIYYVICIPPCTSYEHEYHFTGKIEFGHSDTTILISHAENETVELRVNPLGEIYYDFYGYHLGGYFIDETEISFEYRDGGSSSHSSGWRITGRKQ